MRKINEAGLALIKRFEGCVLKPYKCPAGVWTCGWGHTGPDVDKWAAAGKVLSQHQADTILEEIDLPKFEEGVERLTKDVELSDNEFSALVSFAFNVGLEALATSTLLKKLRGNQRRSAADEFLRWNKANGKVLAGLTKRREEERELFRLD